MTDTWIEGDDGRMFIDMTEGEKNRYAYRWEGARTISSVTVAVYRDGTDITSSALPSGTNDINGDVITIKRLNVQTGDANQEYVISITGVVDGNTEVRKQLVKIRHPSNAP